jgi:hypothetical protein
MYLSSQVIARDPHLREKILALVAVENQLGATVRFRAQGSIRRQEYAQAHGFVDSQIQDLKKNTSLKPEQKLEQLKQISDDIDAKVTPLLDQQQQQKFQQIRGEHRRELIEQPDQTKG